MVGNALLKMEQKIAELYMTSLRGIEAARTAFTTVEERRKLLDDSCAQAHQVLGVVTMFAAGADAGLTRLMGEFRAEIARVPEGQDLKRDAALVPLKRYLDMLDGFREKCEDVVNFCHTYESAQEQEFLRRKGIDLNDTAACEKMFGGFADSLLQVGNRNN